MATVVNNPTPTDSGAGMGFLAGVILLIAGVFLFLYFGLPLMRGIGSTAPQVTIPDKVDVNINNPSQ